jgi:hypothetical protein
MEYCSILTKFTNDPLQDFWCKKLDYFNLTVLFALPIGTQPSSLSQSNMHSMYSSGLHFTALYLQEYLTNF